MKIASFDTSQDILLIAEIGNNHEGNYKQAEKMIRAAAHAGADAVKFQTFITEQYINSSFDALRFNRLKSFELSYPDFVKLSHIAKEEGVIFLSTPFDLESAQFLNDLIPAFKIASADNNFYPLIKTIALTGKPVLLSSGLANFDAVSDTKKFIEEIWKGQKIQAELAVLHCVTSYPVPPSEANLDSVRYLKDCLDCTIGYSDHTVGIQAAIFAGVLGARIIEKHFTLDKNHSDFRDHKLSAVPEELAELKKMLKEIPLYLGNYDKTIQKCEKDHMTSIRRSIAAARDLPRGWKITFEDLIWTRPGLAVPPGQESLVMGKILNQPVKQGEMIRPEFLSEEALV